MFTFNPISAALYSLYSKEFIVPIGLGTTATLGLGFTLYSCISYSEEKEEINYLEETVSSESVNAFDDFGLIDRLENKEDISIVLGDMDGDGDLDIVTFSNCKQDINTLDCHGKADLRIYENKIVELFCY